MYFVKIIYIKKFFCIVQLITVTLFIHTVHSIVIHGKYLHILCSIVYSAHMYHFSTSIMEHWTKFAFRSTNNTINTYSKLLISNIFYIVGHFVVMSMILEFWSISLTMFIVITIQ